MVLTGKIDSGLVGLVLSYAMKYVHFGGSKTASDSSNMVTLSSTTQSLNWVIRSASDVEQNIVSVERILTYINVKPEAPADIPETKPAPSWPASGAVRLE